jgi:toxin FitB
VTGFPLDTNVLLEFSRSTLPPHPSVNRWVVAADPVTLFTSVLCLGEIRKGIELLTLGKKRRDIEQWIDSDLEHGSETISFP